MVSVMDLRSSLRNVAAARTLYAVLLWLSRIPARVLRREGRFASMSYGHMIEVAYEVLLGRRVDETGRDTAIRKLRYGAWSPADLAASLMGSGEFRRRRHFSAAMLGASLHASRCDFVRSLPAGRRILDLGGTNLGAPEGAIVSMGYPYSFDSLTIIDLPVDERHEIYQAGPTAERYDSAQGPVYYRYHSMTDLSGIEQGSVDLVYSGQSIEHVTPEEGRKVIESVYGVLAPGGYFALDTPNGRVTRIQQPDFIDPDHKVEYTLGELTELVTGAGFEMVDCKGANLATSSAASGRFDAGEVAGNAGLYWQAEDCYLLCLVARKPL